MTITHPPNRRRNKKNKSTRHPHPQTSTEIAESNSLLDADHCVVHDNDVGPVPPAPLAQKIAMTIAVVFPFAGVITAIVMLWQLGWMGWPYLAMFLGGWILSGLGVTVGFHRLLTHRSFETYRWIRIIWMSLGALSIEGSPLTWCAIHRMHHGKSDVSGDPHSPHLHGSGFWGTIKGFVHSHVGWLFSDYWSITELEKYVPDLMKDRLLRLCNKFYWIFIVASVAIPTALGFGIVWLFGDGSQSPWFGAFLGLIWGGLARIFFTHHLTWSINSICHVFGSRPYQAGDRSTNNVVCGVFGFGEGWHNNHHAFPTSARHGLRWWQIDTSWMVIRSMEMMGLAWNVKLPSKSVTEAKRRR